MSLDFPLVYISVLNWNNYTDTIKCVESVLAQDYSNYKLFVVDNASSNDSLSKMESRLKEVAFMKSNENLGYAGGHKLVSDLALKEGADLVWILNNDIVVKGNTLSELVVSHRSTPNAIVGSVVAELGSDGNEKVVFSGNKERGQVMESPSSLIETSYCHGCSFIVPTKIVRQFGFINTSYFLYFEEYDFALQLKKHSINSYISPKSVVVHNESASMATSEKLKFVKVYYKTRNLYLWQRRNLGYTFKIQWAMMLAQKGFVKNMFSLLLFKKDTLYYQNLAVLHGLLGITGKTVSPEKLL